MENEKFQDLMLDQFAKLFKEFQGLKSDVSEVKADLSEVKADLSDLKTSQIRMENKFDEQITALHDFRVSQEQANQDNKDAHITLGTKIEELQFEARITDQKLEDIAEDVSYLARKSFRQERQLTKLNVRT